MYQLGDTFVNYFRNPMHSHGVRVPVGLHRQAHICVALLLLPKRRSMSSAVPQAVSGDTCAAMESQLIRYGSLFDIAALIPLLSSVQVLG